jgi:hypothetical protein
VRERVRTPAPERDIFPASGGTADATGEGVQGTITSRDVLLHSITILRLWGPAFYVRCIVAIASRRSCTFLDVLAHDR